MAFKIQIVEAAQRDMSEATEYIYKDSPATAQKWLLGLAEAIYSLAEMPLRYALIPEAQELKRPLRGFLYHSHRIVYEVDDTQGMVSVLRIWHSARLPIGWTDLKAD